MNRPGVGGFMLCPQLQADGRGPACVHNYLMNALYFCNSEEIEAKADSIAREKLITSCKNANVVNVLRRPIGERITSEVMVR
jgi:Fe-S-cluster-containing dehydrogenase component